MDYIHKILLLISFIGLNVLIAYYVEFLIFLLTFIISIPLFMQIAISTYTVIPEQNKEEIMILFLINYDKYNINNFTENIFCDINLINETFVFV